MHDRPLLPEAAETFADLDGPLDVDAAVPEVLDAPLVELELLGRGGLGEVVECLERDLRRTVALKRPLSTAPSAAAALFREAQITAQLTHPAVPAVHAVGRGDDGRPWFTMTRLRGRTLAAALEEGLTWSMPRRVRLFLQIAQAVTYAHHRGVLHRDLKPANVFLGEFGEVHVMDWGIARVLGDTTSALEPVRTSISGATVAGRFAGTVEYASPEQLRGEVDLDVRSDVYSLGAVLYAIATGHAPVVGDSAEEVRDRVLAGHIPNAALEGVPQPLAAVLRRAMALERSDRYADVPAMMADLEAWLDGRPIRAFAEGHVSRLHRWYHEQERLVSRYDVDLYVLTGGCLGGFVIAVFLSILPSLGPWAALWCAAWYVGIGTYVVRRTTAKWHLDDDGKLRVRYTVYALVILCGLIASVVVAFAYHPG